MEMAAWEVGAQLPVEAAAWMGEPPPDVVAGIRLGVGAQLPVEMVASL